MSRVHRKGYNTVVLPYWGKGEVGQSYRKLCSRNQAVKAGGGLGTHSAPTSSPAILQRRKLKPRDGQQLYQSPSRAQGSTSTQFRSLFWRPLSQNGELCLKPQENKWFFEHL